MGLRVAVRERGPVLHPGEVDCALELVLVHAAAEDVLLSCVLLLPHEAELCVGPRGPHSGEGRDQLGASLALAVAPDEEEAQRARLGGGPVAVGRDSDRVGNPVRLDPQSLQGLGRRGRQRHPAVDEPIERTKRPRASRRSLGHDMEVTDDTPPACLQDRDEEEVAGQPGRRVGHRKVDDARRGARPAQKAGEQPGLDPNRIPRHAAADLPRLRTPEVEGVEAVADGFLVGEEPFGEACDTPDLRRQRRDEPDRLCSHGRP